MSSSKIHRIRPAGRHILTIGRDLIQDSHAAIVELVKNAYDADSPDVKIDFMANSDHSGYKIVIEDNGHGMSQDDVINKWMVPSTEDKWKRRKSPSGRIMQGSKGIGRYAASILGNDLLLETITPGGDKTTLNIQWDKFKEARHLDDVEIVIATARVSDVPGTRLITTGNSELLTEWNQDKFDALRSELKKLISPVAVVASDEPGNGHEFRVKLKISNFPEVDDIEETVEPYPLFELFDYRISGTVHADGTAELQYSTQKARNTIDESVRYSYDEPTGCGNLVFDIRVYDRDKESIEVLIKRGLKNEAGEYFKTREARRLLNSYNGIGVYRNGFRIRPLGDPEFDWLRLNQRRVQNPSLRIGSNQVIGHVQIEPDENSYLVEKSARDGLIENKAFARLKEITLEVISRVETHRFDYRQKAGLSRSASGLDGKIDQMFSSDNLSKNIKSRLDKANVDKNITGEITEVIRQDAEDKNKLAEDIRRAVAIYQGQATLGKIINVIMHEGRQPLSYFSNQVPNLKYWHDSYLKTRDAGELEKCMRIISGVGENADIFVKLFRRLDPLAAGRRYAKEELPLNGMIQDALNIFHEQLKEHDIVVTVTGADDFLFSCWQQDIYAIFTNLVDNSVYWIDKKKPSERKIKIDVDTDNGSLCHIDYRDTGPGIEPGLIESEVIFEPEFSTKPDGTGLGLAIAGEAATRNGLKLKVIESGDGACFKLQPIEDNQYNG